MGLVNVVYSVFDVYRPTVAVRCTGRSHDQWLHLLQDESKLVEIGLLDFHVVQRTLPCVHQKEMQRSL